MTPETTETATRTAARKAPAKRVAKAAAPKAPVAKKAKRTMSDDHKAALAQGRVEGKIVTSYLNALEANRPKRGRKRTAESIAKRQEAIAQKIKEAGPIHRLQLIQELLDLQAEVDRLSEGVDLSKLEEEFVKVAKSWGARKGITSTAWKGLKVPPTVLKRAGL